MSLLFPHVLVFFFNCNSLYYLYTFIFFCFNPHQPSCESDQFISLSGVFMVNYSEELLVEWIRDYRVSEASSYSEVYPSCRSGATNINNNKDHSIRPNTVTACVNRLKSSVFFRVFDQLVSAHKTPQHTHKPEGEFIHLGFLVLTFFRVFTH